MEKPAYYEKLAFKDVCDRLQKKDERRIAFALRDTLRDLLDSLSDIRGELRALAQHCTVKRACAPNIRFM